MSEYLVGIDVGGTSADIHIEALNGEFRETLKRPGFNYSTLTDGAFTDKIHALIKSVSATYPIEEIKGMCFGVAGLGDESKQQKFSAIFRGIYRFPIHFTNDAIIALNDLLPETQTGIVYCLGTGGVCLGKDLDGTIIRAGGNGYLFDDANGASAIGLMAIKHVLRYKEDTAFLTALETVQPNLLLTFREIYKHEQLPKHLAAFADPVLKLFSTNHPTALTLIDRFLRNVLEILSVLEKSGTFPDPVPLYVSGGLCKHHPELLTALKKQLPQRFLYQETVANPARGAVKRLRRKLF